MLTPTEAEQAAVARAKAELHAAIAAVDPLEPLRKHPFTSVTIAAMLGAVTALTDEKLTSALALSRSISSVVHSVASAAENLAATRGAGNPNPRPPGPAA
jgi:hypothetical protein